MSVCLFYVFPFSRSGQYLLWPKKQEKQDIIWDAQNCSQVISNCYPVGSVPFVLVPALVLTWHHVKIVTGRTIVDGTRVVSGAEKK